MLSVFLQAVRTIDIGIFHFLNGFAGNRLLDYVANFEEQNSLFKGGLFLAAYWYFWFRPGADQLRRRRVVIAVLLAALMGLVASRTIANFAPYRIRPMYDVHLRQLPYAFPSSPSLVNWSAFPSDTATFFFALALGIAFLSRRLAVPALLYSAVWICLPRLYLGVHYASDIAVGGAIGMAVVWATLRLDWVHSTICRPVVAFAEAQPGIFYAAGFLASFEMGVLFDDVRGAARAVFHIAQVDYGEFMRAMLAGIATLGILLIATYIGFRRREKRRRSFTPALLAGDRWDF